MPSPIDDLFESIFGFRPAKAGKAYEMLAAAVCKLLGEDNGIFHDQQVVGQFSESLYQLDVVTDRSGSVAMGEAKDYSEGGKKVGRDDLQKLGGALGDLPVAQGEFFSATDYTKPARQYAAASEQINGKPIDLLHLRPSKVEDEEGRIQEIHLILEISSADVASGKFDTVFQKAAVPILDELRAAGQLGAVAISTIFRDDGTVMTTVPELTRRLGGLDDRGHFNATFRLPGGHLKIADRLVPIAGITYDIPFVTTTEEIVIKSNGESKLLIRAEDDSVDKLITDGDLKRVEFGPDGRITLKPRR